MRTFILFPANTTLVFLGYFLSFTSSPKLQLVRQSINRKEMIVEKKYVFMELFPMRIDQVGRGY